MSEINITKHAMERYAERFKDIGTMSAISWLSASRKEIITEELNKLFEYSDLFYSGELGKFDVRNYYVKDRCVLVEKDNNLITVFKIDFPVPNSGVRIVVDMFKNEIERLMEEREAAEDEFNKTYSDFNDTIGIIDSEIETLKYKIELANSKKESLKLQYETDEKEVKVLDKEINFNIEQLLGNTQLKKDAHVLRNIK